MMNDNISIIGIGRLGLCLALNLEKAGYNVVGCDIDEQYVKTINKKQLVSYEPDVEDYLAKSKKLKATTDLSEAIYHADNIFITVRTESKESGEYDCSQIDKIVDDLISLGRQTILKHLIINCNVNPGFSDSVYDRLKDYNYVVSFNPEWVAQGRIIYDQSYPDLVVIGESNEEAGDQIVEIYKKVCLNDPPIHRMNRLSAEITKVSLNCCLTTKISYANFVGEIAIRSGVDPHIILAAIGDDSRINPKYFKYGYGFGGPCFGRDTRAMSYYANKIGIEPFIVNAVRETNNKHAEFLVEEWCKDGITKEKIEFESVTYKPGTIIIEESQQLRLAVDLAKIGYKVVIKEHPEVIFQVKELYGDLFEYEEKT